MDEMLERLRVALSETWAFYFKAHSFHWNVRGPLFAEYHALFGRIYEDAFAAVDDLAEQVRVLDAFAPSSLDDIASRSTIRFSGIPSNANMIVQLVEANAAVMVALKDANDAAVAVGNDGLANLLQGRLTMHGKWSWMLKASIAEDADQ